jgi:hypothetical protein
MFEKLLPYIRLGIDFLNNVLEFIAQLLGLLTISEEAIAGSQATPF